MSKVQGKKLRLTVEVRANYKLIIRAHLFKVVLAEYSFSRNYLFYLVIGIT